MPRKIELLGSGDLAGAVGADKVCHRRRRHSIIYLLLLFVVLACTPCSYVQLSLSFQLPAQNDKWKLSIQCSGPLKGKAAAVYFHKDIVDHPDLVSVCPHRHMHPLITPLPNLHPNPNPNPNR